MRGFSVVNLAIGDGDLTLKIGFLLWEGDGLPRKRWLILI